jgi:hypothetical protein
MYEVGSGKTVHSFIHHYNIIKRFLNDEIISFLFPLQKPAPDVFLFYLAISPVLTPFLVRMKTFPKTVCRQDQGKVD